MSKNRDNDSEAEALILLFLVLLLSAFQLGKWSDEQAVRESKRYDYLDQFAPQAHLNSEAEAHRTPIK